MALSFIAHASAQTSSVTLPSFTAGDLALVFAFVDGSTTPPSLPAGWTNIHDSGAFSCASRTGYRVLQGGDTTTGTWTNATETQVLILRGQHLSAPIGGLDPSGTFSSNAIGYESIDIVDATAASSWVVAFCGHRTASDVYTSAFSGMTNRSSGSASTPALGCHTQDDSFTSYSGDFWFDEVISSVNATDSWRSLAVEIFANVASEKFTGLAEVSLTGGQTPTTRTDHDLIVRARKTNVAHTGALEARLYEGTTPRSETFSIGNLTTSLTNYTFSVADADAQQITDYSNLSVQLRGYASTGDSTVFEVSRVELQIPTAAAQDAFWPRVMLFAVIPGEQQPPSGPTYGEATYGSGTYGGFIGTPTSTPVASVSLAAGSTPATRTLHSIKIRATASLRGSTMRVALYEGANNRSGDLETAELESTLTDHTVAISDANAATITSYSNLEIRFWGYSSIGGNPSFEVDQIWLEIPAA